LPHFSSSRTTSTFTPHNLPPPPHKAPLPHYLLPRRARGRRQLHNIYRVLIGYQEKGIAVLAVPPRHHERRRPEQVSGGHAGGHGRRREHVVGGLEEVLRVLRHGRVGEEEAFGRGGHGGAGAG